MSTLANRLLISNILDKMRLSAEPTLILSVSGNCFALALLNWCFKVSVLPHVRKNPRFGDFSLESAQHGLNAFTFTGNYLRHPNLSKNFNELRLKKLGFFSYLSTKKGQTDSLPL
jgi:hypothetical protein